MGFFDIFKRSIHPPECIKAYEQLKDNDICKFYLAKIPKYCAIEKILWIEAGVIEDNKVISFRISYYHERSGENIDTKVSFHRYGHHGMSMEDFSNFMRYLSVALHKNKFMFIERGFDDCAAGCVYDKKYAKRIFSA